MTEATPFFIVGLGNPGARYENTPHNLGFWVVDRLAAAAGIAVSKNKFSALYGQGRLEGETVLLVKPQTYMNLSGEAVQPLALFYKTSPQRILVVCDEFNLPLGKLRLRVKGSDGGHNGLKSLINRLGTQEFPRLRIGCGPVPEYMDPADYVLGNFSKDNRKLAEEMADRAAEAVRTYVKSGPDATMGLYNQG
ncbi:MAG: aminoacyl-tRNA hydrolase [Armatimonadetes bacterium]|nr:aminoacyl-tRNA hydrolase [Armatimonadota bacterium]